MSTGTVKWFNETKGFGFITKDVDSKEIFVHFSGIASNGFKNLNEGARVEFDTVQTDRGENAINVREI